MRTLIWVIVFSVTVIQAMSHSKSKGSEPSEGVEKELRELERAWGDALVNHDADVLGRILADDCHLIDTDGRINTKAQVLEDLRTRAFVAESITSDELKVRVMDNIALVTGRSTIAKGRFKGKDVSGQNRWTDVFIRRQGRWQCIASQETRVVVEPAP